MRERVFGFPDCLSVHRNADEKINDCLVREIGWSVQSVDGTLYKVSIIARMGFSAHAIQPHRNRNSMLVKLCSN